METYQCKTCDKTVEIEEYEATFGNNEAYEFSQCHECFDADIKKEIVGETCGECTNNSNGKCILSGWLGCTEDDLLNVKETDCACDSFDYKEN